MQVCNGHDSVLVCPWTREGLNGPCLNQHSNGHLLPFYANGHLLSFSGERKNVLVSRKGMKEPEANGTTLDQLARRRLRLQTRRAPMKVMEITSTTCHRMSSVYRVHQFLLMVIIILYYLLIQLPMVTIIPWTFTTKDSFRFTIMSIHHRQGTVPIPTVSWLPLPHWLPYLVLLAIVPLDPTIRSVLNSWPDPIVPPSYSPRDLLTISIRHLFLKHLSRLGSFLNRCV